MGKSVLLFVVSVVIYLSLSTYAATYGGGSGTADDPYQIWTPAQMNTIGANSGDWGKSFILMADIDMSAYTGTQYNIIGNATTKFTGTFDGNNHKISNLTYSTISSVNYVGLFGYISNATITNLGIESIVLSTEGEFVGGLAGEKTDGTITNCYSTGSVTGSYYVGGLVGYHDDGTMTHCYSTGSVIGSYYVGGLVGDNSGRITTCYATGTVSGFQYVGGLVGYKFCGGITLSYATGTVTGTDSCVGGLVGYHFGGGITLSYATGTVCGFQYVGGLVGYCYYGEIISCYAAGDVISTGNYVGGLAGYNCSDGKIASCYAAGAVTGTDSFVGGLVGYNCSTITSCYATGAVSGMTNIGGLVGENNYYGTITVSFWDIHTSGQPTSAGGIGLSTYQMQKRVTYLLYGWDFVGEAGNGTEDIWTLCEGMNYPKLVWQVPAADWLCPDGVGPDELLYFSYYWLADNCASQEDCDGVDLNYSGTVDLADFAMFAQHWLEGV